MNRRLDGALVLAALALVALFLTITALSLITLDRLKYVLASFRGSVSEMRVMEALGPVDLALLGAILLSCVAALASEWRGAGIRRLISGEAPRLLLLVGGAALLWLSHAILGRGLLVTGDAGAHVARIYHLYDALRQGYSPYWDNYFFGGSTLLQFTGPVFHWIATAFSFLTGDPTEGTKLAVLALRLLAGGFMFALARQWGAAVTVAVLIALMYSGGFFPTYMASIRSSFPQLLNFAMMPAVLLAVERLLATPTSVVGPLSGLCIATIVFIGGHQPTAMLFGLSVGLYIAGRLTIVGNVDRMMRVMLVSGVIMLVGSAYFLVPFAVERKMTADDFSVAAMATITPPSLSTLGTMLHWGAYRLRADYDAYFGLPLLLSTLAGFLFAVIGVRSESRNLLRIWVLLVLAAIQSLCVQFIYVRHLTFVYFWLACAGTIGLILVWENLPSLRQWIVVAYALVLIDQSPLALQPWTRVDLQPIEQAGRLLASLAEGQRVVEVSQDHGRAFVTVTPSATPIDYARVGLLQGPHKQDATKAHNAFMALLKLVEQDLTHGGALGSVTQDMLGALNVGWLVGVGQLHPGLPEGIKGGHVHPLLGRYLRVDRAVPFVVSSALSLFPRPSGFGGGPFWNENFAGPSPAAADALSSILKIHSVMAPDLERLQVASIPVPELPTTRAWHVSDLGVAPDVLRWTNHVEPDRVHLTLDLSGAGYIRLAYPLAYGIRVLVNGQVVQPIPDVMGLIVLPLHAGSSDIVITVAPSWLRLICFWLTVCVFMALCATGLGAMLRTHQVANTDTVSSRS